MLPFEGVGLNQRHGIEGRELVQRTDARVVEVPLGPIQHSVQVASWIQGMRLALFECHSIQLRDRIGLQPDDVHGC